MLLYGKKSVLERLKKNPSTIKELFLKKKSDLSDIVKIANGKNIFFKSIESHNFKQKFKQLNTQGVVAIVSDFSYVPFDQIIDNVLNGDVIPLVLDQIKDPQNLGAIIRNVACVGKHSIVIPNNRSCLVNETVLKVASGGENYIQISKVSNLANCLKKLKSKGVWVVGSVVGNAQSLPQKNLPSPLAVVIGSEGSGIRPIVRKSIDIEITLPMYGAQLSYNAAVAATLMCYEINRKKFRVRNARREKDESKDYA